MGLSYIAKFLNLPTLINNYAYKALNTKEKARVKIAKLIKRLDNRTDKLYKAN